MTKAEELFMNGSACSAAVFAACAPKLGIDEKTAMKIATGLGGGVGRQREVCGVVTAMAMLASLKDGGDMSDPAVKERIYAVVQEMSSKFKAAHGSIVCRELLGLNKGTQISSAPEARSQAYYAQSHKNCLKFVASGIDIVKSTLGL